MPNHQQLKGKVVAVIGASRGIGASAARALAQAGASVAVGARDLRRLEQLAGELREDGREAVAFPVDVRDPAQVESFIGRTVETLGRLDGAFNNAGIPHPPVELAKLSLEQMDQTLSTDLRGTLLAMKAEVQAMRAHGGSIVNMASTAGLQGARGLSDYSAAKHGVIGASKSVALEFAQVIEGVGAAQLAGVNQAHAQVAHLRPSSLPVAVFSRPPSAHARWPGVEYQEPSISERESR